MSKAQNFKDPSHQIIAPDGALIASLKIADGGAVTRVRMEVGPCAGEVAQSWGPSMKDAVMMGDGFGAVSFIFGRDGTDQLVDGAYMVTHGAYAAAREASSGGLGGSSGSYRASRHPWTSTVFAPGVRSDRLAVGRYLSGHKDLRYVRPAFAAERDAWIAAVEIARDRGPQPDRDGEAWFKGDDAMWTGDADALIAYLRRFPDRYAPPAAGADLATKGEQARLAELYGYSVWLTGYGAKARAEVREGAHVIDAFSTGLDDAWSFAYGLAKGRADGGEAIAPPVQEGRP